MLIIIWVQWNGNRKDIPKKQIDWNEKGCIKLFNIIDVIYKSLTHVCAYSL